MSRYIENYRIGKYYISPPIQQKYCSNIVKIFYCKIATLQKYCEILLQYFSNVAANVKMFVLKILIRNIAAILQHNIYVILGFVHSGEILAVLL